MPPEICPEHDLRIDQYGCWACGHAGPITDDVWPSWCRWSADADLGIMARKVAMSWPVAAEDEKASHGRG